MVCPQVLVVLSLTITTPYLVYGYDCDNGYCLPNPQNLLDGLTSNPRRTVDVSSTCRNSLYTKFSDTGDPAVYLCRADNTSLELMYDKDPHFTTYWQSENSVSELGGIVEQWIILNLTDVFSVRSVLIGFTSPHVDDELSDVRPKAVVIERWSHTGQDYIPWQFYAFDCLASFPRVPYQPVNGPPHDPTIAVCKEQYYSGDTITREQGKPFQFVLYSPFSDFRTAYIRNRTIQDYYAASAVRIRLVEPSDQSELASYYAVSSLQINGSCSCYGHASHCIGPNDAECDCVHNTRGDHCEECDPLYEAVPWDISTDMNNASCQRCDCNGNADSCYLNTTTLESVCVSCYGNSYGSQCQHCIEGYYSTINADGNVTCAECGCEGVGLLDVSAPTCNSISGQCVCKEHVMGRLCNQCEDGYWNMSAGNDTTGCQACDHCNPAGTEEGVLYPLCDKISGGCICKRNVVGAQCSVCKPQTFNLSESALLGCTDCECVPGASVNFTCELSADGQCPCVSNIQGRRCDSPREGYFVPKLDYIQLDTQLSTQIVVPATGYYTALVSPVTGSSGNISSTSNLTTTLCASRAVQAIHNNATVCLLEEVPYMVNLTADSRLTLIPTFSNGLVGSSERRACLRALLSAQPSPNSNCTMIGYSVMASLYGKALECQCDTMGSLSPSLCDPYSGQCQCRSGFEGLTCGFCQPNHYNRSAGGCTACDCDVSGSTSLTCDTLTGACSCQSNVTGDKCNKCLPEYYGLSSGSGCTQCQCSQYAVSNDCSEDGSCTCKEGVTGRTCERCHDGFYALSLDGCTSCNCNNVGSITRTCSPDGTCQCKPLVQGDTCSTCLSGFHQLWDAEKPCKMCYCSGHSFVCSTQPGWYKVTTTDRWSLLDNSVLEPRWSVVDSRGVVTETVTELHHTSGDVQEVTVLVLGRSAGLLYYKATAKYMGDQRASYYQRLEFTLSYQSANTSANETAARQPLDRYVILRGAQVNFELWSKLPIDLPTSEPTSYSLRISEDNFIRNDTSRGSTLPDILSLISNLADILIPANFDQNQGSKSTLYSVSLETGTRISASNMQELGNVEICQCPTGYEGAQCESCSPGYSRLPRGFDSPTSWCVPCDCSGQLCDSLTADCDCTGNTTGPRCETCEVGFYGDPGNGGLCMECACYGTDNNTCILEVDGLPTCLACAPGHTGRLCQHCEEGFYGNPTNIETNGGVCQLCSCNGYSNTCHPLTGACIDCTNNTIGAHCEECQPGYYSDGANGCTECACAGDGYDPKCNAKTGACQCLPGLDVLTNCTTCEADFYNQTINGCVPCNCDLDGTVGRNTQCNSTSGQCDCVRNFEGLQCSKCSLGFYSSGPGSCQACECNDEASAPNTTCDSLTGHCECLHDGIFGRSCDRCLSNTKDDFPRCSPCGDCYDGWIRELTWTSAQLDLTFYQLTNLSTQYVEYTPTEVDMIISRIERNISMSQELYRSAFRLLNTTSDVKLGLVLLHTSLDEIKQALHLLANQHTAYTVLLSSHLSTYSNSTLLSLSGLEDKVSSSSARSQRQYSQTAGYEVRLNATARNLTTYRQTSQLLGDAVSRAMNALTTNNASVGERQGLFIKELLAILGNVTSRLISNNRTLAILQNGLERQDSDLLTIMSSLTALSNASSTLGESVWKHFQEAESERTEINVVSGSAFRAKQSVQHLLAAVNEYMSWQEELKSQIDAQWQTANLTESNLFNTNRSLERMRKLRFNASSATAPSLLQIETLILSIQSRQLVGQDVDLLEERLLNYYNMTALYMNDTFTAESQFMEAVEQVQSADRNLQYADLNLNQSLALLERDFDSLQADINNTLYQGNASLAHTAGQTTRVLGQLALFRHLTNQIRECLANSSSDLITLSVSTDGLLQTANQTRQSLAGVSSARGQIFLRLQLQARAVQRSLITLSDTSEEQEKVDQRLIQQRQRLVDLLSEYRRNGKRLGEIESSIGEAEERLLSLIDDLKSQIQPNPECNPQ